MSYLEELLPEFRNGAKIRRTGLSKPVNAKGYIYYKEGKIYNEFGRECEPDLGLWLSKNDWEIYEEPIDWDYVIANSCPCWFWNNDKNLRVKGTLMEVDDTCDYSFRISLYRTYYKNCCPCRRDEVTFYEDMKK